jgi:hypothetical protein
LLQVTQDHQRKQQQQQQQQGLGMHPALGWLTAEAVVLWQLLYFRCQVWRQLKAAQQLQPQTTQGAQSCSGRASLQSAAAAAVAERVNAGLHSSHSCRSPR